MLKLHFPVCVFWIRAAMSACWAYANAARLHTAASVNQDQVLDRVIRLVKKFDKIDPAKVTEKADFQKDLSLDSLDRVELVMAFEEEFSVEIPDAEADKLKCCADVAKYILSSSNEKVSESS
ncbi:Acyl carrier protein 3, mitochondrial [Sesamum angolense]|uniref:Acyl carrier protein n=1 Tax=Sesamum angolense TaxID=2727404 RepID=A0AAE1W4S7_9LAMI|nr:Acyl carrier protein 3, mitochondrial [Sesamum angolense]